MANEKLITLGNLSEFKNINDENIFKFTGCKRIKMTKGAYYDLSGSSVTIGSPVSNSGKKYALAPCSEGDIFLISSQGGNVAQPWAFIDSSGNILEKTGNQYDTTVSNKTLVAPENAAYLIINSNLGYSGISYYGGTINADKVTFSVRIFNEKSLFGGYTIGGSNEKPDFQESTTRIATMQKLPVSNLGKEFHVVPSSGYKWVFYRLKANGEFTTPYSYYGWITEERNITIEDTTTDILLVIAKTNNATITNDDYDKVSVTAVCAPLNVLFNENKSNSDKINILSDGIVRLTKNKFEKIVMTCGAYYNLSASPITIGSPISYQTKEYALVECQEGDVFSISSSGGTSAIPWGFVDASGNILLTAISAPNIVYKDVIIIAPTNTKYLVINNDKQNKSVSYYTGQRIQDKCLIRAKRVLNEQTLYGRYYLGHAEEGSHDYWVFRESTTRIATNPLIDITKLGKSFTISAANGYKYIPMFINGEDVRPGYGYQSIWQTGTKIFTVPEGTTHFCLNIAKTDNSDITTDDYDKITVIVNDYNLENELVENETNIEELDNINFSLPNYWKSYLDNKKLTLAEKEMSLGFNGVSFAFITDVHVFTNNGKSPAVLKYLTSHSNTKKVVFGGDLIVDYGSKINAIKQLYWWTQNTSELDIVNIHGNHDNNSNNQTDNTQVLTDADFYALECKQSENRVNWVANSLYGYEDNEAQKVRYIYLDTGAPDSAIISDAQITWMQSKISELSSGWTVVVFCHQFFTGDAYNVATINLDSNGTKIMNGLDAIYDNIDATIACVVCGHCHRNYSMISSKGYPIIATTCDSGNFQSSRYDPDTNSRQNGTIGEQVIDVYYINTYSKTIEIVRIGDGDTSQDRSFAY